MVKARVGRPRSEKSREAILNAAHDLLNEKGGSGLTIEAIARRAGVGKPTIYRWWPSLADIVLEALLIQAGEDIVVQEFVSVQETLGMFLCRSMEAISKGGGIHLRFLMAHAQKDDDFRERFRDNFVSERRAVLASIFRQAVEHGEIDPGRNLDMLIDIVFGAMWYRLLVGHAAIDETFAEELTGVVMAVVHGEGRGTGHIA